MKELLTYIAKSLVHEPDKVFLDCVEEGGAVRLKLTLSPLDKGRIIGREGRIVKSIRSLLHAAAAKKGKKVFLDIV
ncbi:MAG: KH domain-containing protein [Elusimicrobia bacterium]|nr:KH domain-containing protein [Elusimicrobiota bacterium]